ncbi:hypothetical protein ACQRIT_005644 [Beauveria bassiana]
MDQFSTNPRGAAALHHIRALRATSTGSLSGVIIDAAHSNKRTDGSPFAHHRRLYHVLLLQHGSTVQGGVTGQQAVQYSKQRTASEDAGGYASDGICGTATADSGVAGT